ncbi:MAG TPA: hypothetical protein VMW25_01870 [Clostridia bacterium]|nr:hypothetical protein [Clostridia bacterium]
MRKARNLKLGIIYSFLTIAMLVLIFKLAIPAAVKVSELLQVNKPLPESSLSESILSAPQLYPLPPATNSASLKIAGFSQSNEKVDIYLNDFNVKTLETDSEGKFEDWISLSLGVSRIYAVARDNQDQESPPSATWEVFYEKSPPLLEISEPQDDALIKKNFETVIKGKVAPTSKVTVNDHQVILDNEGNFNYPVKLSEGENKFLIVCTDPAQNKTEKELKVRFER